MEEPVQRTGGSKNRQVQVLPTTCKEPVLSMEEPAMN